MVLLHQNLNAGADNTKIIICPSRRTTIQWKNDYETMESMYLCSFEYFYIAFTSDLSFIVFTVIFILEHMKQNLYYEHFVWYNFSYDKIKWLFITNLSS